MFKWLKRERKKIVKPKSERIVRIIRASSSPALPVIVPEIADIITNPAKKRNHLIKALSGSGIGAITGLILVSVATYLGFRPIVSEASVIVGLPLLAGALTGYVVL